MSGPRGGGPRGPRAMGPRPKVKKGTLTRVLKYMFQNYLPHMVLVVIFIVLNAVCTLQGTLFMRTMTSTPCGR